MSKPTKIYANEHPKFKKKDRILLASADDDYAAALEEEIKLEEAEFNAWVRANNKRIKAKKEK